MLVGIGRSAIAVKLNHICAELSARYPTHDESEKACSVDQSRPAERSDSPAALAGPASKYVSFTAGILRQWNERGMRLPGRRGANQMSAVFTRRVGRHGKSAIWPTLNHTRPGMFVRYRTYDERVRSGADRWPCAHGAFQHRQKEEKQEIRADARFWGLNGGWALCRCKRRTTR